MPVYEEGKRMDLLLYARTAALRRLTARGLCFDLLYSSLAVTQLILMSIATGSLSHTVSPFTNGILR